MSGSQQKWSRRSILASMGASAALAPFIPLLNVSGQDATIPRRVVLFYTPHGTVWNQWRPGGSGENFTLSRILKPLEPFQKKIAVIDGLGIRADGVGAPHTKGPALLWTASPLVDDGTFQRGDCSGGCSFGWNSGPSFDQVIAKRLKGATRFASYEFGVQPGGGFPGAHTIYAAAGQPVPSHQDPAAAYKELFADAMLPVEQTDKLSARRALTFGLLNNEFSALESRVASADKPKVQAHREALNQLQMQLSQPQAQCQAPAKPDAAARPKDAADSVPWLTDRNIELLASALTCDLTRVASLQMRLGENDGFPYRFLGVNDEHHITSHDTSAAKQELLAKIYTWYADRFGFLLKLLDGVPEGDGTMLDHTLVIWGSELGTGANHDFSNVPFVVAGGGKFGVKTGQYLKTGANMYHNRLIVSAMRYMGLNDVNTFGKTDQETGPLAGLGI
ncbi:MAG: hypothetical protein RL701_8061 [Pseudomonadota bacterium]